MIALPPGNEPYVSRYLHFIKTRPFRVFQPKQGLVRHHVLPVGLGGTPGFKDKEGLVVLTHREHYIAHLILWKAYGGKMTTAFYKMSRPKDMTGQHVKRVTGRLYERLQEEFSKEVSEWLKIQKGISKPRSGWRSKTPEETLRKSQAMKDSYSRLTLEEKKVRSEKRSGKLPSEECKEKIRQTLLKRYQDRRDRGESLSHDHETEKGKLR
jgi:hypothetical protein